MGAVGGERLILANGVVVDGTGAPGRSATVVVAEGRVQALLPPGETPGGGEVVDVTGRVVAPGFIDVHHHAHNEMEGGVLRIPHAENMLRQGVTTLVAGNCGGSPWPIGEHLAQARELKLRTNYALLVGHGTLRRRARKADLDPRMPAGLAHMARDLAQALDEGAAGMSSGQANASQDALPTSEVVELCRVLADRGRVYAVHMRDEGDGVFDCVREAVTVAQQSGVWTEVSHLKLIGQANWGRAADLLAILEEAKARGVSVGADAYPYAACYGGIWAMAIPHWEREGDGVTAGTREGIERRIASLGGPERIRIARAPDRTPYEGLTLARLSEETGTSPADVVIDLGLHGSASAIGFLMDEGDVAAIIGHPDLAVVSDGQLRLPGVGVSHPRNYGTFPRVLARYVRKLRKLGLEEAVRKMTGLPAERFGFTDRGMIRKGAIADLTVFDPETVRDTATFEDAHQFAVGIEHVLIGGRWALRDGMPTADGVGEVITF